jgi:DNA-directed RNA polymerase subunit RPC12/RpoP
MAIESDSLDVVTQARAFLNRLAEGARVKRLGVPQLETEATYHYAKGFVQALAHFELCSPAEAEKLCKQVGQWPAPLADDGTLWAQPWIEHGTKPLWVQTIHLDVLDMKSPVQFDYECQQCGETGHFWIGPPWLNGQTQEQHECETCGSSVIAHAAKA